VVAERVDIDAQPVRDLVDRHAFEHRAHRRALHEIAGVQRDRGWRCGAFAPEQRGDVGEAAGTVWSRSEPGMKVVEMENREIANESRLDEAQRRPQQRRRRGPQNHDAPVEEPQDVDAAILHAARVKVCLFSSERARDSRARCLPRATSRSAEASRSIVVEIAVAARYPQVRLVEYTRR
jgi:hypothetical protein